MEHRLRRKGFENTIFCIAVVELACTADMVSLRVSVSLSV